MVPQLITSCANERYRRWKKLSESPRSAKKFGMTLAEGAHLAQVILERQACAYSVILREHGVSAEASALAQQLARLPDVRVFIVADPLYDAVSPVEHGSGLTVEVKINEPARPHRPLAEDALYLDGVQDAGNAGTLIRTALAAGIRHIAAAPGSAGLWSPKVLRAGMGAHFSAVIYENVLPEELAGLFSGKRLAADARGGRDLFCTPGWEKTPTVWMMGAEGPGLSDAALAVADARYLIPIEAACESLNVGAAAAVCLFEQRRRRRQRAADSSGR